MGQLMHMDWAIPGMPHWVSWVYLAITAVAAITDYRNGKIYNWLTLPSILLGFGICAYFGGPSLKSGLAGFGLATALFVPLFVTGVLGGGDVKLLMALGTVLGAKGTFELACASIIIASAGALVLLFKHQRVRAFMHAIGKFFRSLFVPGLAVEWPKLSRDIKAPFGIAIFCAFIYVVIR